MPKKNVTADELIWLFHEKLASTSMRNAKIAIIPGGDGSWTALTSAKERRLYPDLEITVTRVQKQLRAGYSLKNR